MAHDEGHHKANGAGYEVEDASVREVIYSGIGLAVGTIIIAVAVLGLFRVLGSVEQSSRQPLTQWLLPPHSLQDLDCRRSRGRNCRNYVAKRMMVLQPMGG